MELADLRPHPADEAELRWRFNEAEGEMGRQSTFGGMVAGIERGGRNRGAPTSRDPDSRALAAAGRARVVDKALAAIGTELAGVLRAAYSELPAEYRPLTAYPGDLPGLVVTAEAARRLYARSRSRKPFLTWLARLPARVRAGDLTARAAYGEITVQAEAALGRAGRAYSVVRRGAWPSGARPARNAPQAAQALAEGLRRLADG